MEINLNKLKTVHENASEYYEKAKRMREKIGGAERALQETLKKIDDLKKKKALIEKNREILIKASEEKAIKKKSKQWYENFRWAFIENFLIVGGKDATSNEILIKKHTENNDLVLHTDVFGSPFFVVKNGKNANDEILRSAASLCASYSRVWKNGIGSADVYCVKPEQVSKTAKAGEFLAKGSFMIYGERRWFRNTALKIYICFKGKEIFIAGEGSNIIQNFPNYVCLTPGTEKAVKIADKIKKFYQDKKAAEISSIPDDEIQRLIPYGHGEIAEMK